jgi:hypothetical protein
VCPLYLFSESFDSKIFCEPFIFRLRTLYVPLYQLCMQCTTRAPCSYLPIHSYIYTCSSAIPHAGHVYSYVYAHADLYVERCHACVSLSQTGLACSFDVVQGPRCLRFANLPLRSRYTKPDVYPMYCYSCGWITWCNRFFSVCFSELCAFWLCCWHLDWHLCCQAAVWHLSRWQLLDTFLILLYRIYNYIRLLWLETVIDAHPKSPDDDRLKRAIHSAWPITSRVESVANKIFDRFR